MFDALAGLRFDNTFVRALPGDPSAVNRPRQVTGAAYSHVLPTPVAAPRLLAHAQEVATCLGIGDEEIAQPDFAEIFAGNRLLPGMTPVAACYGGHQFGNWAGQLGDGRAISLGEVVRPDGARWELQLKGAGRTPYSRTADGRAVVRSSVREFLCSEAMHHLGVPTTRALCLVATGESVVRDLLYDGNPRPEPGAIVCRVAPSFLRFGNFEIFTARQEFDLLRALADYTITTHYPHLGQPSTESYGRWFDEICRRTAEMVVHWMRVGFVHGVMNTDNMSILGLTIDYGPYGWLEGFDPGWTPNITDAGGRRYRFGAQPRVALWNLVQLANALVPLVGETAGLERSLQAYGELFEARYFAMMSAKLGLVGPQGDDRTTADKASDSVLLDELMELLPATETDMTIFFRQLATMPLATMPLAPFAATEALGDEELVEPLRAAHYETAPAKVIAQTAAFLRKYAARLHEGGISDDVRKARMNAVNPQYVLRNYLAQLAIDDAERGDGGKVHELLEVLRRPYDEQPGRDAFAGKRPEWARSRAGCSMLSCSS